MFAAWIRVLSPPLLAAILFVLPLRLGARGLLTLAMALWLAGGLSLLGNGVVRLWHGAQTAPGELTAALIVGATILGIAKGLFVLGKTSARNIARIQAFEAPQRAVCVYALKSWLIIEVMMLISASLTWLNAPDLWRGAVNLAIGLALTASSLRYASALRSKPA